MAYRGDFLLGTLLRFLPMVTTILLWQAIYQGSGQSQLAGFDYREMIAYLLLTNISRMFSSMPGLAGGIARDIREGTLKRYLIQPVDLIGYLLSYRVAHKVAYIVDVGPAVRDPVLRLPRLLRRLPRARDAWRPTRSRSCWRSWSGSSSRRAWGWSGSGSWR